MTHNSAIMCCFSPVKLFYRRFTREECSRIMIVIHVHAGLWDSAVQLLAGTSCYMEWHRQRATTCSLLLKLNLAWLQREKINFYGLMLQTTLPIMWVVHLKYCCFLFYHMHISYLNISYIIFACKSWRKI